MTTQKTDQKPRRFSEAERCALEFAENVMLISHIPEKTETDVFGFLIPGMAIIKWTTTTFQKTRRIQEDLLMRHAQEAMPGAMKPYDFTLLGARVVAARTEAEIAKITSLMVDDGFPGPLSNRPSPD